MAKTPLLRDHSNAEPLVKAWDAADADASFSALLLTKFPPRTWLSSEASRKKLESRLSKVSLDSRYSNLTNFRHVCKCLNDAAEYGENSGWDTGAEPYTGPLPIYEDVEAIRIIGSKPGGFGALPKSLQGRINAASVGFLLEDPSDRKTPIHPFWASRVAREYPETEKTTEDNDQETTNPTDPVFAHLNVAGTLPKSTVAANDDHENLDGRDDDDDDDDDDDGSLVDLRLFRPVHQRMTTRSASKKTQQELPRDESEEESPRSPVSSHDNDWEDVAGSPHGNGDEEDDEEDDDDNDDDDEEDEDDDDEDDENDQDGGRGGADPEPAQRTTVAQDIITSHAFVGLLTDALRGTGLPVADTRAVRKAVNADSTALRKEMGKVLRRAAELWWAESKKPILRSIGGDGDDGGGEAAETGGLGSNKKRRRTSSSLGAQRRD